MLRHLPAFSSEFGIHPWDVDRMTFREIEHYMAVLAQRAQQRRLAALGPQRRR